MGKISQWVVDWHAAHEHRLRCLGISSAVRRPEPGTPCLGRPKATAVRLTLESGERTGRALFWATGATSLLFFDLGTGHTWQDQAVLASEDDLPRILAPLVGRVEATTGDGG